MLPEYEPTIDFNISIDDTEASTKKSFLFDFERGEFSIIDGKIQAIEGIEALKIWIQKILNTEKFKFKIYDTCKEDQYGTALLEFIGGDYPPAFLYAEIQREVTEALLKNPEITDANNFYFIREKRTLNISFDVSSIYGVIEQVVSL